MKNKLLFTTALACFISLTDKSYAERISISIEEESKINSSISNSGSTNLQGGVALNQGKLSIDDNLIFTNNQTNVGGAFSTVNNTQSAVAQTIIGNNVVFEENLSAM